LPLLITVYYNLNARYADRLGRQTQRTALRIMFYNVENLFDWFDDPLTDDDEFLPEGQMHWTRKRFEAKVNNIYKVIVAAGEWEPPDIISFAEVENRYVLEKLVFETPLLKYPYKIVHRNSPDQRGIDAALIYRSDRLEEISENFFRIYCPDGDIPKTRDILYCTFKAGMEDTLHIFVNHWPSRSGGLLSSERHRLYVASVLRSKTDSLFAINQKAQIIILGDFNDQPDNKSLKEILEARQMENTPVSGQLYNLSSCHSKKTICGTHKYQGNWSLLDQVIVSGDLLDKNGMYLPPNAYQIFDPPFLLEPDDKYLGKKPYRTYSGYRFNGGYSDHLPVYVDISFSR
jgi:hypothetical protein